MQRVRFYGTPPFNTVVVHGGPGAGGEMAPVARHLARQRGVLEPIQTATSLTGQVEELLAVLRGRADAPAVLIGFSWGAWLSYVLAARYPSPVKKLILVGSPPFEESLAAQLRRRRLERLEREEREEFQAVARALKDPDPEAPDELLARLGTLASKADQYDPILETADDFEPCGPSAAIFRGVWTEAAELRRSGELLHLGREIRCPVIAIHGDYDPHPAEGVREPLATVLSRFRFILLEGCGHKPWIERRARDEFFAALEAAIP